MEPQVLEWVSLATGFVALSSTALVWLLLRSLGPPLIRACTHWRQQTTQSMQHQLREFFLFIDPGKVWMMQLGLVLALTVAIWLFADTWRGALAGTAVVLAFSRLLPRAVLAGLRTRRMRGLEQQLPDFLMSLAAALRAGAGLQVALRQIVPQSPHPLAQEMGLVLQAQRMGVSFDQALLRLNHRLPGQEMLLLVSALRVAAHSGGQLAETLERIATTLRQRLTLQARIQALTSQGRMQAWVMAALPLLLAAVLHHLDPQSMALLWRTPMGWAVLTVIAVLQLCGWLLIRRIVAIDI